MSCNCGNKGTEGGYNKSAPVSNTYSRVERRQSEVLSNEVNTCGGNCGKCGACDECLQKQPFAQLEPTEGHPTMLTLYSTWGTGQIDLEPMIKAGETDTLLCFNEDMKQLEYSSEHYLQGKREQDVVELICLWRVMKIEDHGNASKDLHTGDVYMYDNETHQWNTYPLQNKLDSIDNSINELNRAVANLTQQLLNLADRVKGIEDLIYDYPNDKTTKIPRGNMIFRYSPNNGSSYPYFIKAADENSDNVVRGRVQG